MPAPRVFPGFARLGGAVVVAVLLVALFGASAMSAASPASAAPAAPASVGAAPAASTASMETQSVDGPLVQAQDDSGPEIDPQTEADADKAKSKFVVALIAAALLGIIVWGRIVRRKRSK